MRYTAEAKQNDFAPRYNLSTRYIPFVSEPVYV